MIDAQNLALVNTKLTIFEFKAEASLAGDSASASDSDC